MNRILKLYIILICMLLGVININAQIFKKDSLLRDNILQFGLGGYTGVEKVKPLSDDYFYAIDDGWEYGVLVNLYVNITKHFYVCTGYRWSNRTNLINHGNYAFYESFDLTLKTAQIPIFIAYKINNKTTNLFDIGIGAAYNNIEMNADFIYYNIHPPGLGYNTINGSTYLNVNNSLNGTSFFLNLNKTLPIYKKATLILFTELEWLQSRINILNSFSRGQGTEVDFLIQYQTYLYRLGIILKI